MTSRQMPRDGLRATCPEFTARAQHRGRYYIRCRCGGAQFWREEERDQHYVDYCCGHASGYAACEIRGGQEHGER